ncbi:MAG: hypothetical protein ACRCYP_01955 [Alphaproteobacteria bacterium]
MSGASNVVYSATDLNALVMADKKQKNAFVVNPITGGLSFGRIPDNNNGIDAGEIYLKLGLVGHGKQRKGAFGVRHVWEKHQVDLGISKSEDTPSVIASILTEGADILVDMTSSSTPARPIVLNTSLGIVVLEKKLEQGTGVVYYSLVSAYGKKNMTGTVIGKLLGPSHS